MHVNKQHMCTGEEDTRPQTAVLSEEVGWGGGAVILATQRLRPEDSKFKGVI